MESNRNQDTKFPAGEGINPDLSLHPDLQNEIKTNLSFRHPPRLVPNTFMPKKTGDYGFEYAEHGALGDNIVIYGEDGKSHVAVHYPLVLPNGMLLSYGQINGLAGDFYGTAEPISDGETVEDQGVRFLAAWNTLARDEIRQPEEARAILDVLKKEVDLVNKAIKKHEDPSKAYSNLPDVTLKLEAITDGRPSGVPGYLGLAFINWDHFGKDAHTAYAAGHSVALEKAKTDLNTAYALNAFADHFLEDSFAAGHTRTPRRYLHSYNVFYDGCAKYMHDEDNAIGLDVTNGSGSKWKMYGDKRLFDQVDKRNMTLCQQAVQASADEIFRTWKTKEVPKREDYAVWKLVPNLESACGTQELAALFRFDGSQRSNVLDRRTSAYTTNWTALGTCVLCKTSGWWDYPITIDGPGKKII